MKIMNEPEASVGSEVASPIPVATNGGKSETAIPTPVIASEALSRMCPYAAIKPEMRAMKISKK